MTDTNDDPLVAAAGVVERRSDHRGLDLDGAELLVQIEIARSLRSIDEVLRDVVYGDGYNAVSVRKSL